MDFIRCFSCKSEKQHDNFATYMRNGRQHYRLTCNQCLQRARQRRQQQKQRRINHLQQSQLPVEELQLLARPAIPLAFQSTLQERQQSDLGRMSIECIKCKALHWLNERTVAYPSTIRNPLFGACCSHGDVAIPLMPVLPPLALLQSLYNDDTGVARHFRMHIRKYNSALAFVSLKYQPDQRTRGGLQCFQIHGALYHLTGPLQHATNVRPQFAQIFLYDPEDAIEQLRIRPGGHALSEAIEVVLLQQLLEMLHSYNPFIAIYRTAHKRMQEVIANVPPEQLRLILNPRMELICATGSDRRRHNVPVANEVAMIIPDEYGIASVRDIVLAYRNSTNESAYQTISLTHAAYTPLHYTLLFPHGEYGWHWALRVQHSKERDGSYKRLSQRQYYQFRLHTRSQEPATLFQAGRLFQQYVVDAFAVVDQAKLEWIRMHQAQIRADLYNGLADTIVRDEVDASALGRRIVLPSSFLGSDRFMQQRFQDSMAIVRYFGKPTLFITFIANPSWKEIQDELLPHQAATDRPDLIARVFHLKQKDLLSQIRHVEIFGRFLGCVWTIEYQKRGLPHMHLLLFLHPEDRFLTPERIDEIICAELPTPLQDPTGDLRTIIGTSMVHGPCRRDYAQAPCMQNHQQASTTCAKRFPKAFQDATVLQEDGYPLYRRRNTGDTYIGRNGFAYDNRWVVPYNPYLSWRYQAHINVEVCASVQAIKYIHKYIYKGSDRTTIQLQETANADEVQRHLQGRYIGPCEAIWRLFEYRMHEEFPAVYQLPVHLPGEQPVYFAEGLTRDELRLQLDTARSKLMAWFAYNLANDDGRQYLYQQFPEHFVFREKEKCWQRRQRGLAIGRMYHCNPMQGERFYLRLLLTVIPGATSFTYLQTVEGTLHPSFKQACVALGLLQDDREWIQCFEEAILFATGSILRTLFATAVIHGGVVNAAEIWNQFKLHLCDDLPRRLQHMEIDLSDLAESAHLDYGLYLIALIFADAGKGLVDYGLPAPIARWDRIAHSNPLVAGELAYDIQAEQTQALEYAMQLNADQRIAYDTILEQVASTPQKSHFFIQGPAGTGKTFLYKCICSYYRGQGKIVLCVASSGIAALLLPGGRTAHSRFAIPIDIHEASTCNIGKNTQLADLIRQTSLIIWDEVPMQHRYCFTAVSRTLNDLCNVSNEDCIFRNIPVLLGGDYAQIAPVVRRGNRATTVQASLISSELWHYFRILWLTVNMRVQAGLDNSIFANWLQTMSYNPSMYGNLSIPEYIRTYTVLQDLIDFVYPPAMIAMACTDIATFQHRCILAFHNDTINTLNAMILEQLPGNLHIFHVVDTSDVNEADPDFAQLPAEYMQSLTSGGLPPSRLVLKVGAPVILLRNLYPKEGLCNGTRMIVTRLGLRCIEGQILGGDLHGQCKLIPRILLSTAAGELPFILTRKQFPIKLCFAMTVNKSQGQTLGIVGLDLRTAAFTHGQLYVAMSRVTNVANLAILHPSVSPIVTQNVVFPELLVY